MDFLLASLLNEIHGCWTHKYHNLTVTWTSLPWRVRMS